MDEKSIELSGVKCRNKSHTLFRHDYMKGLFVLMFIIILSFYRAVIKWPELYLMAFNYKCIVFIRIFCGVCYISFTHNTNVIILYSSQREKKNISLFTDAKCHVIVNGTFRAKFMLGI